MNAGEHHRAQAARLDVEARDEPNPVLRAELVRLAASYRRLAEQADRNARLNLVYETPPRPQVQQQQQQQQPQTKPKKE